MQRSLWRLAAASGFAACVALGAVPAGASGYDGGHRPSAGPVQVADQAARTDQDARSSAQSEQLLPVNANVPVQLLSLGSNGGDTKQSNDSTAKSAAVNEAKTSQSIEQNQVAARPHGWYGDRPEGHEHQGHDRKGHDRKRHEPERRDCRGDHGRKDDHRNGDDSSGHGPKGGYAKDAYPKGHDEGQRSGYGPQGPFQGATQHASTDQDAHSSATSEQFLPTNVNAPIQILSLGHNGGDTEQSNDSTAESAAVNDAWTGQRVLQDQGAGSGAAFQGAGQSASTDQEAQSSATSEQIAPVNVNAPIQVLSLGHNGGDTAQSNSSSAQSLAGNQSGTFQGIGQAQGLLG
jgi:hypothetical protein